MIELNDINDKVCFNEEAHTYHRIDDGKELIGVTTMMKKMGLSHNYDGIPHDVLAKAAEHGHLIHNACYLSHSGGSTDREEVKMYSKMVSDAGYKMIANEYLVSDFNNIASCIDCVYTTDELEKKGKVIIADIKTTASYDKEQVEWQLSFYKWLFEEQNPFYEVAEMYCIWLPNLDKYPSKIPAMYQILGKPTDAVVSIVSNFADGLYKPEEVIESNNELAPINEEWVMFLRKLDELKKREAAFKETLLEWMAQNSPSESIEKNGVRVTYVPGTLSKKFDTTSFKKDHPDLYAQYCKDSLVKESIRIKLK